MKKKDEDEREPQAILEGTQADLEEAWAAWAQMSATGWRFLPYEGGLLDQPELLMSNVFRIERVARAKEDTKDATR